MKKLSGHRDQNKRKKKYVESYRAGSGEFHSQGRAQDHGETAAERVGSEIVLSLSAGGHARGVIYRDPGIHHKEAEHGRAVHCDATDSGPL